jgi:hypothetical protein
MKLAQITSLAPQGSFNGQSGLMFKFGVTLSDGTFGEANAKSQQPPYQVGDQVGYDITGDYQGTPCLKITGPKKLAQLQGQPGQANPQGWQQPPQGQRFTPPPAAAPNRFVHQQAQAPAPMPQSPPTGPGLPPMVHGATVGMAINKAVEIHAKDGGIDLSKVYQTASDLIRIAWKLEHGQLAEKLGARQAPPTPQQQPQPQPQHAQAPAGRPGPDGQAYNPAEETEDVPF